MTYFKVDRELISIEGAPLSDISHGNCILVDRSCDSDGSTLRVLLFFDIFEEESDGIFEHIIILNFVFFFTNDLWFILVKLNSDQLQSNVGTSDIANQSVMLGALHMIDFILFVNIINLYHKHTT